MRSRTCSALAFACLALLLTSHPASAAAHTTPQDPAMRAIDGDWLFLEDRTPNRPLEQLGAPMSPFSLRAEADAVILVRGHGSGNRDVRVALDGSINEVVGKENTARYRGSWKDGTFEYQVDFIRAPGQEPDGLIRRSFRHTPEGLIVTAWNHPTVTEPSVAVYRHAEDIPMPTPAKAVIADLAWLAGAWVGTRGAGGAITTEERWSPPLGGSMLATSRTVAKDRLRAFEYLRIVERDGGLVYVAQPGGAAPTEFVLSELSAKRAVFDNPRHDYPGRIVYELADDGVLRATIGQIKGGTPRQFEFRAEAR
ncbi:MAG: DUF6265 family protein [Planctomycetota bacterium]